LDDRCGWRTETSDITFTFPWWARIVVFLVTGWPGTLIGTALGAPVWRAYRIIGGAVGALMVGLPWAYERLELGPWFGLW
jgi:hypothetical protein